MTDEHFMRQWAEAHDDFSADLDRGVQRLGRFLHHRQEPGQAIGKAYDPATCNGARPDRPANDAARAALSGLAACVATTALFLSLTALMPYAFVEGLQSATASAHPLVTHFIVA